MENINLKFQYTEAEYTAAMRLHYSNILSLKRDLILALIMLVLGIIDLSVFGYSLLWVLVVALSLFFLFMLLFANFFIPSIVFKREMKLKDEYELEFTDAGINFHTVNLKSQLQWKIYNKVIENDNFFLLYWGKYTFTVIPKRAFQHEAELESFKNLLMEKIPIV
jgi:hypothetical protein